MNTVNCERKIANANLLLATIVDDANSLFFKPTNLLKPDFNNKELSFLRLVSWLYTIYFEVGKTGIGVVTSAMSQEAQLNLKSHKSIVQSLRTVLQHNIDRTKGTREYKIEMDCMEWTKRACNRNIASSENDWLLCSLKLITEAEEALDSIVVTLEEMTDSDCKRNAFISNWSITTSKSIEPHIFDEAIRRFVTFIDIDSFDTVKYRNKNISEWRNYIANLNSTANLADEVDKIVESSLVEDFISVLPISYKEMCSIITMDQLNVRDVYKFVHEKVLCDKLTKEELIVQLTSRYSSLQ